MRAFAMALVVSCAGIASPVLAQSDHTSYATVSVNGLDIFYREAGPREAPTIVMLHGRQTSSHMYRNLIPRLASRYHIIAIDFPGFGESATPPLTEFHYTFDSLANITRATLAQLGVERYALVMQDWGVPVGFRLAAASPDHILFLVAQNGVICEPPRDPVWLDPFWTSRDPAAEQRLRNSFHLRTTKRYYQLGASHPERIAPEAWALSQYYIDMPGRHDVLVEIMHDDPSNWIMSEQWLGYLRMHQPPTLVLWGRDSPIYSLDHVDCYSRANPDTTIRFYNGGHFILEEYVEEAAAEIFQLGERALAHRTDADD